MNEMIEALQKLVSFQSIAKEEGPEYPFGKEVHDAKEYVLNLAKSFGMRVTDVPGKYAYIEIGEGPRLIGILSHLDVVPAGDGWTQDPFGGEIVDGKIYGRGTTDDKGPTIAVLYAMKALKEKNTIPARIRLILGQTEENGEWRDIEAYTDAEEIPECGFTPDGDFPAIQNELGAMVFQVEMPRAEAGFLQGEGGTAPNMVPAHARVKTEFGSYEASGKACHGCAPWLGVNGISELMEKVHRAEPENRFARMYADLIGKTIYGEKLGIAAEDESGKLTLNAGLLEVQGDTATLMVDIRYPAKKNPAKKIVAAKKKINAKKGKTAKIVIKVTAKNPKKVTTDAVKVSGKKIKVKKITKKAGKITIKVKALKKGKRIVKIKVGKASTKVTLNVR